MSAKPRHIARTVVLAGTLALFMVGSAARASPVVQGSGGRAIHRGSAHSVTVRVGDRVLRVAPPVILRSRRGGVDEELSVIVDNHGRARRWIGRSDFALVAEGDVFGTAAWSVRGQRIAVPPRGGVTLRLRFAVPASLPEAALFYRPTV